MSAYPVTLYFSRLHTRGLFKGSVTHGSLGFVSLADSTDWLKRVRSKGERGQLPYRIVDASYQKYVRT